MKRLLPLSSLSCLGKHCWIHASVITYVDFAIEMPWLEKMIMTAKSDTVCEAAVGCRLKLRECAGHNSGWNRPSLTQGRRHLRKVLALLETSPATLPNFIMSTLPTCLLTSILSSCVKVISTLREHIHLRQTRDMASSAEPPDDGDICQQPAHFFE